MMADDGGVKKGDSLQEGERRLAAIMFSDIVGYTAMTQSNEKLTLGILESHRMLLRPLFPKHGGTEVKTIGDAFLVEFRSALDAVNCAVEMQRAISRHNEDVSTLMRVRIRIGIHVGDIVVRDRDVYGDTVNIASRIEKLAESGGIAISSQVYQQVWNKVTFPLEKMGDFQLKNVESPTPVYSVSPVWDGVRVARPEMDRRLAVLPLRNIGPSQADEYLADGLTEELISSFSMVPTMKVIARSSVLRFKGSQKSVSEVAKELRVGKILEGSIRRSGNNLRVSVQLIDAVSEECLWAAKYDRPLEDILAIEEQIAEDVTAALRATVGGEKSPTSHRSITTDPAAFILYLKGRFRLTRHTQSDVEAASRFFEDAIAKDPKFASAYAMLAQCRLFLGFFGFIQPQRAFDEAQPLLKKALEVDADLDIAHMLMGRLLMDRDWDWVGAEAEFRRALERSPNSAEGHYRYALLLHNLGRNEQAISELDAAEDLDPLSVAVNQVAGTVLYYTGRNAEAIERFQRALEIEPRAALAHTNLGLALFETGDRQGSIAEIQKAIELDPKNYYFKTDLCYVYSRAGMLEDARRLLIGAEADASSTDASKVAVAGMCACVGERSRAIAYLEEAYKAHSAYLASLRVERWFDNIRSDPAFVSLLRRLGLGPNSTG